jgi:hypothetical protein
MRSESGAAGNAAGMRRGRQPISVEGHEDTGRMLNGRLQVTGATVVQAIAVYGKLNAQGQLIERRETLSLNELFERMTVQEKEAYARDGKLPEWFTQTVGNQVATGSNESDVDADADGR